MKLNYAQCLFRGHTLYLAASQQGLVYVGSYDAPFAEMAQHFSQKIEWQENLIAVQPYVTALTAYAMGKNSLVALPLDILEGTIFQREVWQALRTIPYGQTVSYAQIAEKIGRPKAVRAVGNAIGRNPLSIVIPCHRVITTAGTIGGYSGGLAMKRDLHQLEQIILI